MTRSENRDNGNRCFAKKSGQPKPSGSRDNNNNKCSKCRYTHAFRNCPAYNKQCRACNKMNHFAQMCRNKTQSVNAVETDDDHTDSHFPGGISVASVSSSEWLEPVKFVDYNAIIQFKIDCGSLHNIMPKCYLDEHGIFEQLDRCMQKFTD